MKINNSVKKISLFFLFLIALTICFNSCLVEREYIYDENWMIGKNSEQIQAKFGKFIYTSAAPNEEDGLYYDCKCGYYTYRGVGLLVNDLSWNRYLILHFNEDGVVYKTSKKLEPVLR